METTKNGEGKLRGFSSADLQQFDGQNGSPFYVVFRGKVYDLSGSKLWIQGKHMGVHTRNENLGETIKGAPHSEDLLERFPLIGEFDDQLLEAPTQLVMEKKVAQQPMHPAVSPEVVGRRNFLKLAAAAGATITVAAVASTLKVATFVPTSTTKLTWPIITVANISQLQTLSPVSFNYPLTSTPNVVVKLGVPAKGGVGPDSDIVAFSTVCQHLGCQYSFIAPGASPKCNAAYKAAQPMGYCCCHGSQYDFVNGAKVLGGPAPRPVPQVQLEFDSATGNINAIAMLAPTIFGHGPPGTTDPALIMQYDLQGGDLVTQETV
jgi:arsenite oxidase small subunit